MHARSVMEQLEHTLFQQVKDYVYPYVGRLRKIAHALGQWTFYYLLQPVRMSVDMCDLL